MSSFADLRRMMVDCQLRTYDVTDRAVLAAADSVPREAFLPGELSHLAYLDRQEPLPGTGRALPAPMVTARMIQVLDLQPGEEALEYGGGSGYGAALMAAMGAKTTLLEPDEAALALARTAFAQPGVPAAELLAKLPEHRQFDAVLVSGACEMQPEPLFRHVRQGGRLIVVEGGGARGARGAPPQGGRIALRPAGFRCSGARAARIPQGGGVRAVRARPAVGSVFPRRASPSVLIPTGVSHFCGSCELKSGRFVSHHWRGELQSL